MQVGLTNRLFEPGRGVGGYRRREVVHLIEKCKCFISYFIEGYRIQYSASKQGRAELVCRVCSVSECVLAVLPEGGESLSYTRCMLGLRV